MNVLKIREALESFPQSEARTACFGELAQSKEALEVFLDWRLWVDPVDKNFQDTAFDQYYADLGQIEEHLVIQGLIYEDSKDYLHL